METGTLVHLALAALGVSSLLAASPVAFAVVRYAWVGYLVWLAVRTLRQPTEPALDGSAPRRPLRRVYADGALVNVLNPKVALFFLAFLPQFISPDLPAAPQLAVYATVLMALGLALDLGYAALGGGLRRWLGGRAASLNWSRHLVISVS